MLVVDDVGVAEHGKVLTVANSGTVDAGSVDWEDIGVIKEFREVVTYPESPTLDPGNGSLQIYTLITDTAFIDAFENGQSLTLHLNAGASYSVTWPAMRWIGGSPPVLSQADVISLWKVDGILFGSYVGPV
jgi:hypothetical protein